MADKRLERIAYMGEHTGSLEAGLATADILFSLLLTPRNPRSPSLAAL
jgi:hypothetical protein